MLYVVTILPKAHDELMKYRKSGNEKLYNKVLDMIDMLKSEPRSAFLGKPERLKHMEKETWSRRITDTHRLVYEIDGFNISVKSVRGHYEDK